MHVELKEKIKSAADFAALTECLKNFDGNELTARDVALIDHALNCTGAPEDLRIAYLGSHTMEPLPQYVRVRSAIEGIGILNYTGPYGQYFQEVLTPESGLAQFRPNIALLSLLMRQISPDVHERFAELSRSQIREEKRRVVDHATQWVEAAKSVTDALLLVANFPRPSRPALGIADAKDEYGETEFYTELNLELLRALKNDDRAFLLDMDRICAHWGARHAFSPKSYYMAKMPWADAFCSTIAEEIVRFAVAATGRAKKCLVVDLDNTLWGGVLGEDGASAVRIGPGDPESEAYRDFQLAVRALKARGLLLAACSKNNVTDVDELFDARPDMPLKKTDFAASQINWEPKHVNLARIAESLNIGIDSLAFVDDSAAEIMLVANALPAVKTLRLPDPATNTETLLRAPWLERLTITAEDREKTAKYAENARRGERQQQVGDIQTYLAELRTELVVGPARAENVQRVHQLFSKTNQFNVTTKRYGIADVQKFINDDRWYLAIASVKDAFGDMGIIGLYLLELEQRTARIDSFVMSCRALGRAAESMFMNHLKQHFLLSDRADRVLATFVPTPKNAPAEGFFESQGFELARADSPAGAKEYALSRQRAALVACNHIKLVESNG